MSIPREGFEQGFSGEQYLIVEFLKTYLQYAFTAEGIQSQLPGFVRGEIILLNPGGSLDNLVERGAIDRMIIDGLAFYTIHRD